MTPRMPMHHMMEPAFLTTELLYAAALIAICAIIYAKTKDLYRLSAHEGIRHFREAFLFFALAYLFRLIPILFRLGDLHPGYRLGFTLGYGLFSYASAMAVMGLARSTTWKKLPQTLKKDAPYHALALLLAATVIASGSTTVFFITQATLIAAAYILVATHKKKQSATRTTYLLLLVFWMLNLAIIMTPRFLPGARATLYAISLSLFLIILYKTIGRTRR